MSNVRELIEQTGDQVDVCGSCDGVVMPPEGEDQTHAAFVLKYAARSWECECSKEIAVDDHVCIVKASNISSVGLVGQVVFVKGDYCVLEYDPATSVAHEGHSHIDLTLSHGDPVIARLDCVKKLDLDPSWQVL